MTFDKRGLLHDLLQGAEINYSKPITGGYDRIIDSTGVARAALPLIADDLILPYLQVRVETAAPLDNQIKLESIGYAWCFSGSDPGFKGSNGQGNTGNENSDSKG